MVVEVGLPPERALLVASEFVDGVELGGSGGDGGEEGEFETGSGYYGLHCDDG